MAYFGKHSKARLGTCDPCLQDIFHDVILALQWTDSVSGITIDDCSIICGHRTEEAQDLAFKEGASQVEWPNSGHNGLPSLAVDAMPYHSARPNIHWSDVDEMEAFSHLVHQCAAQNGYRIRWGGDWDSDGVRVDEDEDESFMDGPHYELVTE